MVEIYRRDRGWSSKGHVKKLNKQQTAISPLLYFILTVMYTVAYNSSWRAMSWLWYGVSLVAIVVLLAIFINNDKVKFDFYTSWAIIFLVYSLFSCLWAIDMEPVFDVLKTLGLIFIVHVLLAQIIDKKEDVEKLLKANFIALLILLLYVVFNTDLSMLGKFRIGVDTLGELWNANDIGIKMSIGAVLSLYFMTKGKGLKSLACFVATLLFLFVILMTGSRTALLIIAISIFMFFWLKAQKHKTIIFIVMVVVFALGIVLILKVPFLYDIIGSRVENIIKELMGQAVGEGSFNARQNMIELGLDWFKQRPLFGYGLNNFGKLYAEEVGYSTYSHNNFIEMLISGGIVGFIIYYLAYVYLFVNLIKQVIVKKDLIAITLFVFNLSLIIMNISNISYYSTADNCMLMLALVYIRDQGKNHENN